MTIKPPEPNKAATIRRAIFTSSMSDNEKLLWLTKTDYELENSVELLFAQFFQGIRLLAEALVPAFENIGKAMSDQVQSILKSSKK